MCLTFSVCSQRFSVIMMSLTSCKLLFHPLDVLSTLPVSMLCANARSGPKQTHCPCCVFGLTATRGLLTSTCRDSIVMTLPSAPMDTSKRRPSSHTTDLPTVEYCTPASASQAAVSVPNVICLYLLSDLTSHGLPN